VHDPVLPSEELASYLDCEKVSTDIKYYSRDFVESSSVLEDTVQGISTCRVFIRFENLSNFLKFSEIRKSAGKDPEYDIIKSYEGKYVRVNFDLKVM
jgi:hypothetical protein